MINPTFLTVLHQLYTRLNGTDINWAVTGSLCFALQGVPMPEVHDIDLQSDAAGAYAQLAATALGLATVWIGSFDEAAVRQAIGVGDDLRPIVILPVGYTAETPDESVRRPVADLVHRVE